jgi:DNA-binding SARP family transcriptional activator/DNA-binding CsgD family transcriptional regulator
MTVLDLAGRRAATQIRLCGRLQVQLDGTSVEGELAGRQGRLLFAYLLFNRRRPVRRDELVEAVWGEDAPANAASQLSPPLSRLRKALGAERVVGRTEVQLVLPGDAWIDWEVAQAALSSVRDGLATGDHDGARAAAQGAVDIADSGLLPGLEAPWLDEQRRTLADIRVESLEALARIGLAFGGGDLPAAEQHARDTVEAAPFRESGWLTLMEILRARGNVAEALRTYEKLRALLMEELGAVPSSRVATLHADLLRADAGPAIEPSPPQSQASSRADGADAAAAARAAAAAPTTPPAPLPPRPPRRAGAGILERDRELAELSAVTREAVAGAGRVVTIEGPAGIGKSRLLAELRDEGHATGALVLDARGSVLEREFPFGMVRQLYEAMLANDDDRARLLTGAAAPAAAVFGVLDAPGAQDGPNDASFAALHGLFWLTLNVATERPLVLALDDLQWADRPSLRFVAYLVRRLEGMPALVAATIRTGERATDPALLAEVTHDPAAIAIRPGPLSEEAVTSALAARLDAQPDPSFAAACHRATGGNPLLLYQLMSALEADGVVPDAAHADVVRDIGPRAVGRSVLLRLARLSEDAVTVARCVAVLGDNGQLPAIAALAEIDERRVAAAVDALAGAEILRREPPIGFAHPLIRDAVYREVPPGERELQHWQAAHVLAELGATPEQISTHLLATANRADPWSAATLLEAGTTALRRGAPESAIAHLRRALEEPPPAELKAPILIELGVAEVEVDAAAAMDHLREAHGILDDPMGRAGVAVGLARVGMLTAPPDEVSEAATAAAAELADADDPALVDFRQRLDACTLFSFWFGASDPALAHRLETHDYRREDESGGAQMLRACEAYNRACRGEHVDTVLAVSRAAVEGGLLDADNGLINIGALLPQTAALSEDAQEHLDAMRADSHRRGSPLRNANLRMFLGEWSLRRGDIEEALEDSLGSFDDLQHWGRRAAKLWSSAYLCSALTELGEYERAHAALARGGPLQPSHGSIFWLVAKAALLLAEGRAEEALPLTDEAEKRCGTHLVNPAWAPWPSLRAEALNRLGRAEEALPFAQLDVERARGWGGVAQIGSTLRVLGAAEGGDAGLAHLAESVEMLTGSLARLELAKSLAAYGAALRRARRPSDARDPLRRALELADSCGSPPLAEFARGELYASGARPRSEAMSGVAALTASERRVVDLAVEGRTNRDIAQALFVTPKTIEVHLSNAYRKLDIRSRHELAEALTPAEV